MNLYNTDLYTSNHQVDTNNMSIINAAIKDNPRKEDDDGEILVEKEKKECEICLKLLPAQSFRQEVKDIDCHHTTYICTTCLKDAIKMNVEIYSWSAIPCPFDDCENILDPSFLKKFLSGRLLEQYESFPISATVWKANHRVVTPNL